MRVVYKKADARHPDSIECEGFDELEEGIRLYTKGEEPGVKNIIGYLPHNRLTYILPTTED